MHAVIGCKRFERKHCLFLDALGCGKMAQQINLLSQMYFQKGGIKSCKKISKNQVISVIVHATTILMPIPKFDFAFLLFLEKNKL